MSAARKSKDGVKKASPARKRERDAGKDSSSSLTRMLGVLDLFTVDRPLWSTQEILDESGTSRSTGYRYIKALTSSGLLTPVGNGHYILGPRIIELDLQIRKTDPLLQASDGILEELVTSTGYSALLCTLFQSSVLCVRECLAESSPTMLIDRGQRRPLFKGAMSKVILAHLSDHQLRNMFPRRQEEISAANMGENWEAFRKTLSAIRLDGYAKSTGEFTPGVVGIAAPVFNADEDVIGSVGVAWDKSASQVATNDKVIAAVMEAAREISRRMLHSTAALPALGPRAVGG